MISDILIWVAIALLLIIDIKNIRKINWCKEMVKTIFRNMTINYILEEMEEEEKNK